MGIERKGRNMEFSMSMVGLLQKGTVWSMITPVGYHTSLAKEAGYDAIEYWPIRPVPSLQVMTGVLSQRARDSISSAHQSYRSETSFRQAWTHENKALAMQSYFLLPNIRNSTQHLEKLQAMLGDIPVVMFPYHEGIDSDKFPKVASSLIRNGEPQYKNFHGLNNKLVETAPELLGRWQVTPENFGQEAQTRGYRLCIDTKHFRRLAGQGFESDFGDWRQTLPHLLPFTDEVHVNPESPEELEALTTQDPNSDFVQLLQTIGNSDWTGLVTTEVRADLIAEQQGVTLLKPKQLVEGHKPVVEAVRNIFS